MEQHQYLLKDGTIGTYRDMLAQQLLELMNKKFELQVTIDNVTMLLANLDNKEKTDDKS